MKSKRYFRVFFVLLTLAAFFLNLLANRYVYGVGSATISEEFNSLASFSVSQDLTASDSKLKLKTFSENFSYTDGPPPSGWSMYSSDGLNPWQIYSGVLRYPANDYNQSRIIYDNLSIKNGEITVDARALGGEQFVGIMFRVQDEDNYYRVTFSSLYNFIAVHKIVGGVESLVSSKSETYNINTWYTVKVIFFNDNIKVYVNDVLKLDVTDTTFKNSGKIGFWRHGAGADFDNLSVRSLSGQIVSSTHSYSQNIKKVSLSFNGSYSTSPLFLVSNNNGDSFYRIKNSQTLIFPTSGKNFKYKIIFPRGTSTSDYIDNLTFSIYFGEKSSARLIYNQPASYLQYSIEGNAVYKGVLDPNKLSLYHTISNNKFVQQGVFRKKSNGDIVFFYVDMSTPAQSKLKAYNLTQKTLEWEVDLEGFSEQTPAIFGNTIYIGSYAKKMFAIDVDSGTKLWEFATTDTISGSPIIEFNSTLLFNDYGYAGTTTLYAVDTNTHSLKWSFSRPYKEFMSFAVDEDLGLVYVTYADFITAFSLSDGSKVWSKQLGLGFITKSPALSGDKIVVGADRGIAVLDVTDGSIIWSQTIGSNAEDGIGATPTVFEGVIYYPTKNDKKIYARKLSDGSLIWSTDVSSWSASGTFSTPVVTQDGYIYLAYNEKVIVLRASDGAIVKTFGSTAWAENNVSLGYGYMVFTDPSGSGTIYVYRVSEEEFSLGDTITIDPGDRTITKIYLNNSLIDNFSCSNNLLSVSGSGTLKVEYNSDSNLVSSDKGMIFSIDLPNKKIAACYSGTGTFSYRLPSSLKFTEVFKNNSLLSRNNWSISGGVITITDHFSKNVYEFVEYSPSFSDFSYLYPTDKVVIEENKWQPNFELILPASEFTLDKLYIYFWKKDKSDSEPQTVIGPIKLNPLITYSSDDFKIEVESAAKRKVRVSLRKRDSRVFPSTYLVYFKFFDIYNYMYQSPTYEFTVEKSENEVASSSQIASISNKYGTKKHMDEAKEKDLFSSVKKTVQKFFSNKSVKQDLGNASSRELGKVLYNFLLIILIIFLILIARRIYKKVKIKIIKSRG